MCPEPSHSIFLFRRQMRPYPSLGLLQKIFSPSPLYATLASSAMLSIP